MSEARREKATVGQRVGVRPGPTHKAGSVSPWWQEKGHFSTTFPCQRSEWEKELLHPFTTLLAQPCAQHQRLLKLKLKVQLHLHHISTKRCVVFKYLLSIREEMAATIQTGQSAVKANWAKQVQDWYFQIVISWLRLFLAFIYWQMKPVTDTVWNTVKSAEGAVNVMLGAGGTFPDERFTCFPRWCGCTFMGVLRGHILPVLSLQVLHTDRSLLATVEPTGAAFI